MLVAAAIAVFLGATLQSATGFGFALVAAPVLFAVATPEEAVTTVIVLSTVTGVMLLAFDRNHAVILRRPVVGMLAGAVPGAIAGVFVLEAASKEALQVVVGVGVIAAAAMQARRAVRVDPHELAGAPAIGLLAGILTTTTSLNGPPLALWLQHAGVAAREFRATLAASFIGLNVIGLLALLALAGGEVGRGAGDVAILVVVAIAGQFAGREVFHRLDAERFRLIGIALAVISGAATLGIGLATLL
ncbi:MAG: sulfite exporter TauE/SafE family protein [Thermoleophilaceae bacterium]|nr:sulfite exporter TauE/SafE family protein [Thermoleophilaceae bacterium]